MTLPATPKTLPSIEGALTQGGYRALVAALSKTALLPVLRGDGPFTVFAPSDGAFAMFPPGWVDRLVSTAPERLRHILSFHFAVGQVMSMRLFNRRIRATMYSGQTALIDGRNGLSIEGAVVVTSDLQASNGVIHGIDRVLWPQDPEGSRTASAKSGGR